MVGMDNKDNLVNPDLEYDQLSEAVRRYAAERIYSMVNSLELLMPGLFDGDPAALAYMEPARIATHTQVAKLYLSAVKELGDLYRVRTAPAPVEPEEPMVPASQVPLMIEAAVETAVALAVDQVKEEMALEREDREAVSAAAAREQLVTALARIRSRAM